MESDLLETTAYKYSDLGYYLFKDIIEERYNLPLNNLVDIAIYKPLGLATMGYLPTEKFEKDKTGLVVVDGELIERPVVRSMLRVLAVADHLQTAE